MFYYATGIVPSQWNRLFAFLARSGVSQQFLNVRTIVDTNIQRFVLATGSNTSQVCSEHLLAGFELSIFRKDGTMLLDRFKLNPAVLLASSSPFYLFVYFFPLFNCLVRTNLETDRRYENYESRPKGNVLRVAATWNDTACSWKLIP